MASTFSALKKTRQSRLASSSAPSHVQSALTSSSNAAPAPGSTDVDLDSAGRDSTSLQSYGLYPELPRTLEILSTPTRGRGIFIRSGEDGGGAVKPGTTLLSIRPHISALSTSSLDAYCSACHAPPDPQKEGGSALKRCTRCKIIWYCSSKCQAADWAAHKPECTAIVNFQSHASSASANLDGGGNGDAGSAHQSHRIGEEGQEGGNRVPNEAVRALARMLWKKKREGGDSVWWREIEAMQSHRENIAATQHGTVAALAHTLTAYLSPTPSSHLEVLSDLGIGSARDLVDLLSKFTTNSFTLSTPSLSPIGVFISPITALINHSCAPNAVIVFPRAHPGAENRLEVIAIRDIQPGEEVLTSYIDISVPRVHRQKELKERYLFDCDCSLCSADTNGRAEPREGIWCSHGCGGVSLIPDAAQKIPSACEKCGKITQIDADELKHSIQLAEESLEKATAIEFTDPARALLLTTITYNLLLPTHPASSHPLLALTRFRIPLLINELFSLPQPTSLAEQHQRDAHVDEVCRAAAQCVAGVREVFPEGHPVRGIAIAELGKLLCVEVSPVESSDGGSTSSFETGTILSGLETTRFPRGADRLRLAFDTLLRARHELGIGFGVGGGDVGRQVEGMIQGLERELSAWRKVTSSTKVASVTSA
ncbi:hypothetical protein BOTBODRAFT_469989 [Botryobasidium botryosum FD-172 SS1]|uniref:MYND-type domain-containing protein n=1 Tax=Botryobasidium botryosum (strain FD-172 SS1) TaxID=930990 RepID=A0A067M627_BOTB1|nr:hypothetical protein BOTBODRAFT_469989 [Botryobasidium botryosum FD-172 SS1]